ncbi:MAG: hypothetical protein ACI4S9_01575 [Christensenellales bacterium]
MDYLMITAATLLLGVDFSLIKIYQKTYGTAPRTAFFFNMLLGLATAVLFFAVNGFRVDFSGFSVIMAACSALLIMTYSTIGFKLLQSGSMAMYTLFLMTGGMVLPYVWGLIFLGEPFSALRTAALIMIMAGVVLSNFGGESVNLKQILMCVAVFVINGCVSIISKMHQSQTVYPTVNTAEFMLFMGIFKFLFAGILYLVYRKKDLPESGEETSMKKAVLIVVLSAVISGTSGMLQLLGAKVLPASVLYPFITGGTIVFSALAGVIVFKEKLSAKIVVSIILCFAGTLMFL